MNLESKLIFIIGPGGVGKSTAGEILAEKIGYSFVDLDREFCQRIELIPDYIKSRSYREYCQTNSKLFEDLLKEWSDLVVLPLSSGFLVHEDSPDIVVKNKQLLFENGVSILLLPSDSLEESTEIAVSRQLGRGFLDTTTEHERQYHMRRYPLYRECGDVKVFSSEEPDRVADLMVEKLTGLGFKF